MIISHKYKFIVMLMLMVGTLHAETVRVNIGGGTYTDVSGNSWSADAGCNTGNLGTTSGPTGGTLDDFLFLSARWDDSSSPEMTCSYAVQPGDYQVTLYFAENVANNFTIGARVFDVTMEGILEFNNIDIFQEAGGGNTALLKTTTVTVNDGQLNIQFLHQVKNPLVKAIEIIPVGGGGNTPPVITTSPVTGATVGVPYSYDVDATDSPGDTLQYFLDVAPLSMTIDPNSGVISWTPVSGDEGPQSVTVRVQDQGGLEDTQSYTLTVVASGQLPIRVNIGGGTYTDVSGNSWSADAGCNTGNLGTASGPTGGTLDDFLFLSARWDDSSSPEMTCSYAVQPGDYQVTLYFAENVANNFTNGARVFDVTMEGILEFNNIDIFQEAGGGNTALLKTTTVTVNDGQLNIQFLHQVKNPLVKAIEIIPTGGSNIPPVITTSPVTDATVGVAYSYDVDATDDPADTLQYFLDVAPLSMTIDPNSGVISWTPVSGDEGPQSVTVRVQDQGGLEDTQSYTLTVVASGQLPIRVNIGGGTYTDVSGNSWSADAGCDTGNLGTASGPTGGTQDDFLFLSARWDDSSSPEMTCSYNLPQGAYEVTLYFAENVTNNFTNGARVFDVTMEGILEFNNIDIFQEAGGGNTALLKTTTVTVNDGQLNIQFLHQVKNPLVKAIQIRELPTGACSSTPRTQVLNGILPVSGGTGTETLLFSIPAGNNGSLGTATITDATTGQFQYLPDGNAWGTDTFEYQVDGLPGGTVVNTYTVVLEPRIMPLGDSITTGVEDGTDLANILPPENLRAGWRLPLYSDLITGGYAFDFVGGQNHGWGHSSFDSDHEGHGGWTATEIAWGMVGYPADGVRAWLDANPADIVLLHAGTNGLVAGGDIEVEAILDEIDVWENGPGGNPVMVVLAQIIDQNPINPVVTTFNANLLTMADDRISNPSNPAYPDDIVVIDQQSALVYPGDLQDSLHPNPTGYAKMKGKWKEPLNVLLPLCP